MGSKEVEKFRDDENVFLDPSQFGDVEHEEEELAAEGDYGHDHIPTDDSEDEDVMEGEYVNPKAVKTEETAVKTDEMTGKEESDQSEESTESEESEGEETEEETQEEVEESVDDKKVPLTRLKKEISKKQALEERLQQLESTIAQYQERELQMEQTQVDPTLFSKMSEALLDGKNEDAMAHFNAILQHSNEVAARNAVAQSQQYADQRSHQSVTQSTQAELLQNTAHDMLELYPILDDSTPEFDQSALEAVLSLRADLESSGRMYPHVALERATQLVMMERGIKAVNYEAPTPPPPPPPAAKPSTVKRKAEQAARQPERLGGEQASGGEPRKLDINSMSDAEFDKLTVDELRRLRGDYF